MANLNIPDTPSGKRPPLTSETESGADIVGSRESLESAEGPGPFLMLAETLTGNDVENASDEKLGTIDGIMLDVQRGRIAYAVLSVGGFLGIGDKLFAIPWEALTLDTDNKRFLLDASKDELKAAPGFDKDHWPDMADERWASEVYDYYGIHPYWE
jgi:hypothetical protein